MPRFIPRRWKHHVSRSLGHLDARAAVAEVRALAARHDTLLAGPWTGEVGFEVLYWIPFLRWVLAAAGVSPDRVVACSRGGVDAWYADVATRYVDVFDYATPRDVQADNERRKDEAGAQKQTARGPLDELVLSRAAAVLGPTLGLLHPGMMFRVYRRYFWRHATPDWLHQYARYRRWERPEDGPALPEAYIALKFYFNDCVRASDRTRAAIQTLVARLQTRTAVVSLHTGLPVDDHVELPLPSAADTGLGDARTNLGRQAAILARARGFVGTYGGYAYVPAFYGVPTTAVFTEPEGFARTHLVMAQSACHVMGVPPLEVVPLVDAADTVVPWAQALGVRA